MRIRVIIIKEVYEHTESDITDVFATLQTSYTAKFKWRVSVGVQNLGSVLQRGESPSIDKFLMLIVSNRLPSSSTSLSFELRHYRRGKGMGRRRQGGDSNENTHT